MLRLMTLALSASLLTATPPVTPAPVTPTTVTIVRVRTPWYAPEWLVTRRMRGTLEQYRGIDGLLFKAYAHATDRHFGGVYFWRDAASAGAWFTPAWFTRVQQQYGVAGDVRRFSIVRGHAQWPTTSDEHSDAVALLTTTTLTQLPADSVLPALAADQLAQYLVRDDSGHVAALTLWRTEAAAAGQGAEQARRLLGVAAQGGRQERFRCPILLPTPQLAPLHTGRP